MNVFYIVSPRSYRLKPAEPGRPAAQNVLQHSVPREGSFGLGAEKIVGVRKNKFRIRGSA